MMGYHGTTKSNLDCIFEKKIISIPSFKIDSTFSMPKNQRLVNDLGMGFYLFLSDDVYNFDGIHNARRYALKYKNDSKVLKVAINDEGINVLDLNSPSTRKIFIQLREKFFTNMYYHYNVSIKDDGAKNRANLDGLLLEVLIRYKFNNQIDCVICDSYTPFYNQHSQLSNIPNGRELCLRNMNLINWDECEEVV